MQTRFLHMQPWKKLALSFCLSSLRSAPPFPLLPLVSISIVPLSPAASVQPGPAHAPSQQLPLKLQRIITTSCSGLLAGQLCKASVLIPEFQGGNSLLLAAASSPKEVPTPLEDEGAALLSLVALRGQRLSGFLSLLCQTGSFLWLI